MSQRVFICYARVDQAFALPLAELLKASGIDVFVDQWDIDAEDDWDRSIDRALRECARLLIVLSPVSVNSREVRGELRTALDLGKPVLPVLYQSCEIPRQLRVVNFVDFTSRSPSDAQALSQVLRVLQPDAEHPANSPASGPVSPFREYVSYLAPLIVSIWLRNLLVSQLIVIPALGAVVLGAYLFYFVQQGPIGQGLFDVPYYATTLAVVTLIASTLPIAFRNLSQIVRRGELLGPVEESISLEASPGGGSKRDAWLAPALVFLAAIALGTGNLGARIEATLQSFQTGMGLLGMGFFVLLFVLQTCGGFRRQYMKNFEGSAGAKFWQAYHPTWMPAACSALFVVLLHLLWTRDSQWTDWARVALGPPLVSAAMMLSVSLLIALMGPDYPDGAREWLSRSGSRLSLATVSWLVVFGIAFYGPYAVAAALSLFGKTTLTAIAVWIGTSMAGIVVAFGAKTGRPQKTGKSTPRDWLVGLTPPLVLVAYLLVVALGTHQALAAVVDVPPRPLVEAAESSINQSSFDFLEHLFVEAGAFAAGYHDVFAKSGDALGRLLGTIGLLVPCVLIAWVVSVRVRIKSVLAAARLDIRED